MADDAKKVIKISINGKSYEVTKGKVTGAELKTLGNVPTEESLYLIGADHKEKLIGDNEIIELKNNEVFESSPGGGVS